MDWNRLDRHQSASILEQIALASDPHLFSGGSSEASYKPLSFYQDYMVYRITNYATLPCFSLDFLSNGESFYLLDGSPTPINVVNKSGALYLTEANIIDYLDFYLGSIRGEDGDIYLIHNPDDLPFLDSLGADQQMDLKRNYTPPHVVMDNDKDHFTVFADLFYGGTMMKAGIVVDKSGQIEIQPHDDVAALLEDDGEEQAG